MENEQNVGWSDTKKWWMDLLRSSLLLALVAGITAAFLNQIDTKIQHRFKFQHAYESDLKVLERFTKASHDYISVAFDAYKDYLSGKSRDTSEIIRTYNDQTYDEFTYTLEGLDRRFRQTGALREYLEAVREANKGMHNYFAQSSDDREGFESARRRLMEARRKLINETDSFIESRWIQPLDS